MERIVGGLLASTSDTIKVNQIYVWVGAHVKRLIESRRNEDPDVPLDTEDPDVPLDTDEKLPNELAAYLMPEASLRKSRKIFTASN